MNQTDLPVNGAVAQLKNLVLFDDLVRRLVNRAPHLPGLGVFNGWSGYGKSFAAGAAVVTHRAHYIECKSVWTPKFFAEKLAVVVGVNQKGNIPTLIERVGEQLARQNRPLIIDEMDHVVAKGMVEMVRDLYESSQAAIVLIGEEALPQKLANERYERFHNRILAWVTAQPCSRTDAAALAKVYCSQVDVADDLLELLVDRADGRARRICVNLERIRELARSEGLKAIGVKEWGTREFYTGSAPGMRQVQDRAARASRPGAR